MSEQCEACQRKQLIASIVNSMLPYERWVSAADKDESGRVSNEKIIYRGKKLEEYSVLELGGILHSFAPLRSGYIEMAYVHETEAGRRFRLAGHGVTEMPMTAAEIEDKYGIHPGYTPATVFIANGLIATYRIRKPCSTLTGLSMPAKPESPKRKV